MSDKMKFNIDNIIGEPEDYSIQECINFGFDYRIVRKDHKPFVITHDLKVDRVNLEIENGIVTNAYYG